MPANLPTPRASDCKNGNGFGLTLAQHVQTVQMIPTPTARDWKDNGTSPAELSRNSKTLATVDGGKLNPTWVEWLMGWPLGWTDCAPLATDKWQSWLRAHGDC
jgi:hypothetical protein